jgi:hypothetical protein
MKYLAKNQSTQRCQSLITQGSDHPPVLEPHMVLNLPVAVPSAVQHASTTLFREVREKIKADFSLTDSNYDLNSEFRSLAKE